MSSDLVVQICQKGLKRRGTAEHGGRLAERAVGGIERHVLRRERRAATGDDVERLGIVQVRHVVLVLVVGFHRDVPLVVELVTVGQAVPLQVVVSPLAAIDSVGDDVEVVIVVPG